MTFGLLYPLAALIRHPYTSHFPPMKRLFLLLLAISTPVLAQKFEGLAPTPPMGWNTWNTFAANINETLIKQTAEVLIATGMRDAGYNYVVLDDAWLAKERDANGNLQADPVKFPSGMKALGDFLHSKGFKFGIYNCAGRETCGGYPGGRGHEFQDAKMYASWGVDYLKYDWCSHGTADARETYRTMRDAIHAAGRPIVFSMCEWGDSKPWTWAADTGHLWRTTGDIMSCYDCQQQWSKGWKVILDMQVGLEQYAGPDHWNDPDMLEVGTHGLTVAESRAHFSFWCMLAAPLMAGNDVRSMSEETHAILTNAEAIAVDQDKLGKQGLRVRTEKGKETWIKELSNGEWAVCVLNDRETEADVTLDWSMLNYYLKDTKYTVRDLWAHADKGTTEKSLTSRLQPHDVIFVRLTPIKK
jgi:alpha-galactosidase